MEELLTARRGNVVRGAAPVRIDTRMATSALHGGQGGVWA